MSASVRRVDLFADWHIVGTTGGRETDDIMAKEYKPTKGDLRFRDSYKQKLNAFEKARLLRNVSHEYLSALAHDNSGVAGGGFKAMIDAEAMRRGSVVAKRANLISMLALAVAMISVAVSVFYR